MSALVPARPKIYHIVHVDCLPSIIGAGFLFSDATISQHPTTCTRIGMKGIKNSRRVLPVKCHRDLMVGDCVPFYFCPRSVMLFVIAMKNHPNLDFRGGEGRVVHLEADLHRSVAWAESHSRRWAFTTGNAGSSHFLDFKELRYLDRVDWDAVEERENWTGVKDEKASEWLIERQFPWQLVERVGCRSRATAGEALRAVAQSQHRPDVHIVPGWYYNRD